MQHRHSPSSCRGRAPRLVSICPMKAFSHVEAHLRKVLLATKMREPLRGCLGRIAGLTWLQFGSFIQRCSDAELSWTGEPEAERWVTKVQSTVWRLGRANKVCWASRSRRTEKLLPGSSDKGGNPLTFLSSGHTAQLLSQLQHRNSCTSPAPYSAQGNAVEDFLWPW